MKSINKFFLIVFVLFYSVNVSALSFVWPTNINESPDCRKIFDLYVEKESQIWIMDNDRFSGLCDNQCKARLDRKIGQLQKFSSIIGKNVNKFCEFE